MQRKENATRHDAWDLRQRQGLTKSERRNTDRNQKRRHRHLPGLELENRKRQDEPKDRQERQERVHFSF